MTGPSAILSKHGAQSLTRALAAVDAQAGTDLYLAVYDADKVVNGETLCLGNPCVCGPVRVLNGIVGLDVVGIDRDQLLADALAATAGLGQPLVSIHVRRSDAFAALAEWLHAAEGVADEIPTGCE